MMMQQPGGMGGFGGNRQAGGTMGRMPSPGGGMSGGSFSGSMGGGMGGSRLPDPYHSPFMGMPQGQMPNFNRGGMGGGQQPSMGGGMMSGPTYQNWLNSPGGRAAYPQQPQQKPGLGWGAGGMGGGMGGNTGFNPGAGNQDFLKQIMNPSGGMSYLGGSQTFDESTGQYRQPGQAMDKLRSVWG